MRSVVLLLMIALLPLRMWAAEGMALRMAQAELSSATPMAMAERQAMPDDCPMTAKAAAGSQSDDGSPAGHTSQCATCHLCAASAPQLVARIEAGPSPAAPPSAPPFGFASAEPRRDHKPPIS